MFEKEAKERARDYTSNKERQVAYECGFLDGVDRMRGEMQKLKEDNADLKQSLDWANEREKEYVKRITELEKAYNETEELLDKQIEETFKLFEENKELEKENAELKEKLASLKAGKDKNIKDLKEDNKVMSDNYSKMEQKFYDNLTQAKELLARWVSDKPYTVSEQKDLISDTEQFLKEE